MTVVVNQEVVPGSIVTVQYPGPQAAAQPGLPQLPEQTWTVDPAEDKRQSNILWMLYGTGMACCCCIPILGLVLWVLAAAIYFCKPQRQRAQYRRARTPACTATISLIVCASILLLMIPLAFLNVEFHHGKIHVHTNGHHHGPHDHHGPHGHHGHHGHHGPHHASAWLKHGFLGHLFHDKHHHGPCHGKHHGLRGSHPEPEPMMEPPPMADPPMAPMAPAVAFAMPPPPMPPPTKEQYLSGVGWNPKDLSNQALSSSWVHEEPGQIVITEKMPIMETVVFTVKKTGNDIVL
jgi:hypothetical protein